MDEELKSQTKYRKIYTLFERDSKFKIVDSLEPHLEGITNIKKFVVTEKIDGTNCGIVITPDKQVLIRKRSDFIKDDKEHHIYYEAINTIDLERIKDYFHDSEATITIFGEACGGSIQKHGTIYSDEPTFMVFDVQVNNSFFDWLSLKKFCSEVGLKIVPYLGDTILEKYTVEYMKNVLERCKKYLYDSEHSEGIVVRSEPPLLNKFGQRMMFKLKFRDFK